jgi:putative flippase GtrA
MSMPTPGTGRWFDRPDMRQLALFIVSGTLATGVNILSRYLLNLIMPFEAAVAIAFCIGAAVAFGLYQVVFGNPGTPLGQRIMRFCVVDAVGAAIALAVSSLFARILLPAIGWTFHPFDVAHLAGVAAPAAWSYLGHRHLTFAARLPGRRDPAGAAEPVS